MDKLTKFSMFMIFSISAYAILTMPHILLFMSNGNVGFNYPLWLLLIMSIPSVVISTIVTSKLESKVDIGKNDDKTNPHTKYYKRK